MPLYMMAFRAEDKKKLALANKNDHGWEVKLWTEGDREPVVRQCGEEHTAKVLAEEWTK